MKLSCLEHVVRSAGQKASFSIIILIGTPNIRFVSVGNAMLRFIEIKTDSDFIAQDTMVVRVANVGLVRSF
jgi:hypothetical protein